MSTRTYSPKTVARINRIADWLKSVINRVLVRYSRIVLAGKAKQVGTNVQFESYWNHLVVPPNIIGNGNIVIGDNVTFWGRALFISSKKHSEDCTIKIGDETEIGDNVSFRAYLGIDIGNKCLIASGVRIFDFNGHPISPQLREIGWRRGAFVPREEIKPVVIEDNVWIGENAVIQPGVRIGRNSIVSANSTVTKDVPPNVIVMGVPARVCFWLDKSPGNPAPTTVE